MADEKDKAAQSSMAPKASESPRMVIESDASRMQREMAEAARDAAERNVTTGEPGGCYIVGADAQGKGGTKVDAEGKPFKAREKD